MLFFVVFQGCLSLADARHCADGERSCQIAGSQLLQHGVVQAARRTRAEEAVAPSLEAQARVDVRRLDATLQWKQFFASRTEGKLPDEHKKAEQKQADPGWYDSGSERSCDEGCASVGLVCTAGQLEAHNADVDSSEEVLRLMHHVGGLTDADECAKKEDYGRNDTVVPAWTPSSCFYSSQNRSAEAFEFSCSAWPESYTRRLCYCHKGTGHMFVNNGGCTGGSVEATQLALGINDCATRARMASSSKPITHFTYNKVSGECSFHSGDCTGVDSYWQSEIDTYKAICTDTGAACQFPFTAVHDGASRTFNACTTEFSNHSMEWCATKVPFMDDPSNSWATCVPCE